MNETITVKLTNLSEEAVFDSEFLPDSATDFADEIVKRGTEYAVMSSAEPSPEVRIYAAINRAMKEFQDAHPELGGEPIRIDTLARIVTEKRAPRDIEPAKIRALGEFLAEKFALPPENVVTSEGGEADADASADDYARLTRGLTRFWQVIYKKVLKEWYEQEFTERVRAQMNDIVWAESPEEEHALIQALAAQFTGKITPLRVRKLEQICYELYAEKPIEKKFPTERELKDLYAFIAHEFADERGGSDPATVRATFQSMFDAMGRLRKIPMHLQGEAREDAVRASEVFIGSFVQRLNRPPQALITLDDHAIDSGEKFQALYQSLTPAQKARVQAELRDRYIEPYGHKDGNSILLLDALRELRGEERAGRPMSIAIAEHIYRVVLDRLTAPEAEAQEAVPDESAEQARMTVQGVSDALRVKNARIDKIVSGIKAFSDAERRQLFAAFAPHIRDRHVSYFNTKLGRTLHDSEASRLQELIESEGAATNWSAWEDLCAIMNRSKRFRTERE